MTQSEYQRWLADAARQPLVMGIINVTPDSFSDGGRFLDAPFAAEHAARMVEAGAGILDIGGESTRPGSKPVPADEQIRRVLPVFKAISSTRLPRPVILSIDTTQCRVAEAAIDTGAMTVNDISAGLDDPRMLPMIARRDVSLILMHMQGTPATMQDSPQYQDVVREVADFLVHRMDVAAEAGIGREKVLLDPGIGFGKTLEHNLALLRGVSDLVHRVAGRPLVVGPSRKGFIGTITGEPAPDRRQFGTAAAVAWCVANGASVVRVHDIGPMYQVVKMVQAIRHCHP